MHEVWRVVLSEQWDVLCAIGHKDHRNIGLLCCSKGYAPCYVGNVQRYYFGIVMFITDKSHPKVNVSYEFGRFIVVETCFEGQALWLVGWCLCI